MNADRLQRGGGALPRISRNKQNLGAISLLQRCVPKGKKSAVVTTGFRVAEKPKRTNHNGHRYVSHTAGIGENFYRGAICSRIARENAGSSR